MKQINAPTVREILDDAANKYGDKTFIRFMREGVLEERSYNRVRSDSLAVCRWIKSISSEKMHIAFIGKTNYEYITCMTGILVSGNIAVPLAPDISAEEASELFSRADIDIVLYGDEFAGNVSTVKQECPFVKHFEDLANEDVFAEIFAKYSDSSEYAALSDVELNKDECAMIIFTSGTTGVRKGVMLSMQAIVVNNMYTELEYSDDYVALSVLPMHHVFCFEGDYLKNFMEGMGICLNGNIRDLGANLQQFQPHIMRVVPLIAKSLLQKIRALMRKRPELTPKEAARLVFGKNMKWMYSGGAYLNPEIAMAYDAFGFTLRQGYGMTEAGCRVSVPFDGQSPESVGKVLDICDARIVNGEVQLRTPSVMMGYYKMPEETAEMFTEDGWLKTGDLGYLDEQNQLFLTGRAKNLIILSNGENVSPETIEKKYESDMLVSEAIVSAENDMLVVEIYPNCAYAESCGITDIEAELNKMMKKINAQSEAMQIVSKLRVRDEPFPKTSSGKTKRVLV